MNDYDRDNLNFLLTASRATMREWHAQASQDDYDYAMELLAQAMTELALHELGVIDREADQDLSMAQAVLSRFV